MFSLKKALSTILAAFAITSFSISSVAPAAAQTPAPTQPAPTRPARDNRPNLAEGGQNLQVVQTVVTIITEKTGMTNREILQAIIGGQSLNDILKAKNVDAAVVKAEIIKELTATIQKSVTEGKLTQQQADVAIKALDAAVTRLMGGNLVGADSRVDNLKGEAAKAFARAGGIEALLAETATVAKLSQREVIQKVQAGETLAQIVTTAGGDVKKVVDAAVEKTKTQLLRFVNTNRISQEEYDKLIPELPALYTELMNSKELLTGPFGRRNGGGNPRATPTPTK
jgi:cell division FtsZ-interacting protein ZapD